MSLSQLDQYRRLRDVIQNCDKEWRHMLGAASTYSGFLDEVDVFKEIPPE